MKKGLKGIATKENLTIATIVVMAIFSAFKIYKEMNQHDYEKHIQTIIENNVENINELSNQNLDDIQSDINKLTKKDKVDVSLDTSKDKNYKAFFKNTVFMGDSITEGFREYDFINKYNVLAEKGQTVLDAKKSIDTLVSINPENVVLLYGMNDVSYYDSPQEGRGFDNFKEDYSELIKEIQKRLPKTNIYIESPLPVMEKAASSDPMVTIENINEIRDIAEKVATETGSKYVNINKLAIGHDDLHEGDGVHYKYDFYPIWLNYLMTCFE